MEYVIGYEKNETPLYSTAGETQFYVLDSETGLSFNFGGLEQTMFMSDKKDDSQPKPPENNPCDGCKCPKKGGRDKKDGCGGTGQGGKKDCDQKKGDQK